MTSNFKQEIFRSRKYHTWILKQPCMFCGRGGRNESGYPTERDHVGPRGLGQKCDDRIVIPACTRCHPYRQKYDWKGLKRETGILWNMEDIWKAVVKYLCKYLDEGGVF